MKYRCIIGAVKNVNNGHDECEKSTFFKNYHQIHGHRFKVKVTIGRIKLDQYINSSRSRNIVFVLYCVFCEVEALLREGLQLFSNISAVQASCCTEYPTSNLLIGIFNSPISYYKRIY